MASYNPRQSNVQEVREAIARAAGAGLGVVAIRIIRGNVNRDEGPVNAAASLKVEKVRETVQLAGGGIGTTA